MSLREEGLPLEGVRVLDLSRVIAGPFCTMWLGDLGADVIKVEMPGRGDEFRDWGPPFAGSQSAAFLAFNRNKRSICIDLRTAPGQDLLRTIITNVDVLVENFAAGTMEKWGLGHDRLCDLNSRLVYCSITGFGRSSACHNRPAYDFLIQAASGLMSLSGPVEREPVRIPIPITDLTAGLVAVTGVLAALKVRESSGYGQLIAISLFDSAAMIMGNLANSYLVSGQSVRSFGNAQPQVAPYETFSTVDGTVALAVGNDSQFKRLCMVLGAPELATDARFATNPARVANRESLTRNLRMLFADRSMEDVLRLLMQADVPACRVKSIEEALDDREAISAGMIVKMTDPDFGDFECIGIQPIMSRPPLRIRLEPPALGQDTADFLKDFAGLSGAEIDDLRSRGVVG